MKLIRCLPAVLCLAATAPLPVIAADAKSEEKEKSPAELAWDSFTKLIDDKEAKPTPERLQKLNQAGIEFICTYPKDRNAGKAINKLAIDFPKIIGRPEQSSLRTAWYAQLHSSVLSKQFDLKNEPDKSRVEDLKAALAALDAAIARGETYENKEEIRTWRERIDELAKLKYGSRFLADREMEFVEVLKFIRPAAAEGHLKKLLESPDKKTAERAREELNYMEVRKQPLALKFTGLDGKEVDCAQLRGRVIHVFFWSAESPGLGDQMEAIKDLYSAYSRKKLEVIAVCYDAEDKRSAVTAFVKKPGMKWPVYFDGKGAENEFGTKLNVNPQSLTAKDMPTSYLFDANGTLVKTKLRMKDVSKEVDRLLNPPPAKK